jgi:hypothetical protein
MKEEVINMWARLAGLEVGPTGPTSRPPGSRFILVSSGVFHVLLVPLSDPFAQVVVSWLDSIHNQTCFLYLIPIKS